MKRISFFVAIVAAALSLTGLPPARAQSILTYAGRGATVGLGAYAGIRLGQWLLGQQANNCWRYRNCGQPPWAYQNPGYWNYGPSPEMTVWIPVDKVLSTPAYPAQSGPMYSSSYGWAPGYGPPQIETVFGPSTTYHPAHRTYRDCLIRYDDGRVERRNIPEDPCH